MTERSQTIIYSNIGTLVLGFLFFITQYVFNDTQDAIKRLEQGQTQQLAKMAASEALYGQLVTAVNTVANDRYTASNAATQNSNFQRQLDSLERRFQALEQHCKE